LFSIGTQVVKPIDDEMNVGEVYDFYTPYWWVRYKNNNWEELSKREMDHFTKKRGTLPVEQTSK